MKILLTNGLIVTNNAKKEYFKGNLLIDNGVICKIIPSTNDNTDPINNIDYTCYKSEPSSIEQSNHTLTTVDVEGQFVIPGFVQAHTHLCQALFRGCADDLPLLTWLKERIWPFESKHTYSSLKASAALAILEMQKTGTTTILDMGTVQHTDALFEVAKTMGIRYWGGKCLMDIKQMSGPLYEETTVAIKETIHLIEKWHNHQHSLLNYVICPRFAVSCSNKILQASHNLQSKYNVLIHTHASETKEEVALIKKRTKLNNIDYLDSLGLLNPKTVIAHGIHISSLELKKMIRNKTSLVHCPSSNLKLGSGIAHIYRYLQNGLNIGLGSDGAPCNNTMDQFIEMRLASLLQKPIFGPQAISAMQAFELATIGGANVLGIEKDIGSLEVGKRADIVTVKRNYPSVATVQNPYSALVYSSSSRDVCNVFIDGKWIVKDSKHCLCDEEAIINEAKSELKLLKIRVNTESGNIVKPTKLI